MPGGASRLGGGRPSQPPRRAYGRGVGCGVSLPLELLGVRGRCKAVMLDDEDIEAIADRVAAKLRLRTDGTAFRPGGFVHHCPPAQKSASQPETWSGLEGAETAR
jgi:hypothetical protein